MECFKILCGNLGLIRGRPAAPRISENEPREPPPPATRLQFPSCIPQELSVDPTVELDVTKLFSVFARTGPRPEHLAAFNISASNDASITDLIPPDFLPPTPWLSEPVSAGPQPLPCPQSPQSLDNARTARQRNVFWGLAKELLYENTAGFRAARRERHPKGTSPVKIVNARKFWNGLADMADYWDTSLDNYSDSTDNAGNDAMDIDEVRSVAQTAENDAPPENKKTYTGRRIDTGSNMPPRFREETVSGFIEMLTRTFHLTLDNPSIQPRLHLHNILFPLPYFRSVHRIPQAAYEARAGVKEGPLLGVLCREQTKFREETDASGGNLMEIMDLLKESGLLALLAQRRAREGKQEVKPGAGKWWASTPRWGGGPDPEFGIDEEESVSEDMPVSGSSTGPPRKRSKKMSQEAIWRAMKEPSGLWEKNVRYQAIGKEEDSEYDDVSFSSHVSIIGGRTMLTIAVDIPRLLRKPPRLHRPHAHPHRLRRLLQHRQSGLEERITAAVARSEDPAYEMV